MLSSREKEEAVMALSEVVLFFIVSVGLLQSSVLFVFVFVLRTFRRTLAKRSLGAGFFFVARVLCPLFGNESGSGSEVALSRIA
jgi:hypothetical protein